MIRTDFLIPEPHESGEDYFFLRVTYERVTPLAGLYMRQNAPAWVHL